MENAQTMIGHMMGGEYDIALMFWSMVQISTSRDQLEQFGINLNNSDYLTSVASNTIASQIREGKEPLMQYFNVFSLPVWSLIFTSIIILSIISPSKLRINSVVSQIWNYSMVLISGSIDAQFSRTTPYILFGVWLLSSVFIVNEFTANFIDFMVATVPVIKINTFKELAESQTIERVIIRPENSIFKASKSGNSSIDRALSTKFWTYEDYEGQNIPQQVIGGLKNGTAAFVHDEIFVTLHLVDYGQQGLLPLEKMHISADDSSYDPYYIFFDRQLPTWAIDALNSR